MLLMVRAAEVDINLPHRSELHKRLEEISNKISFADKINQYLVMNQNGAGEAGE